MFSRGLLGGRLGLRRWLRSSHRRLGRLLGLLSNGRWSVEASGLSLLSCLSGQLLLLLGKRRDLIPVVLAILLESLNLGLKCAALGHQILVLAIDFFADLILLLEKAKLIS